MPECKNIYILAFYCRVTDHSFIVTSAIPSPMSDNWNDNISPCKPTISRRFETIKMESMSKAFLFSSSGIPGTEIIMDGLSSSTPQFSQEKKATVTTKKPIPEADFAGIYVKNKKGAIKIW